MKRFRATTLNIFILIAAIAIVVSFSCITLSKYIFSDSDTISGKYTTFIVSSNGEGQAVVMQSTTSYDGYMYVGYVAIDVSNFNESKVSARDVTFSLRAPTDAEQSAGKVYDAWGTAYTLASTSTNYEIQIVEYSGSGNAIKDDSGNITGITLGANSQHTETIYLRILRKSSAGTLTLEDNTVEPLSVILQTSEPYKDLQVFNLKASLALIMVSSNTVTSTSTSSYHGVPYVQVNMKSSVDFSISESSLTPRKYIATVTFTLSGDIVFDYTRFTESYGIACIQNDDNTYVFTVPSGTDVNLYFYPITESSSYTLTATATIDNDPDDGDDDDEVTTISGVDSYGVVVSQ